MAISTFCSTCGSVTVILPLYFRYAPPTCVDNEDERRSHCSVFGAYFSVVVSDGLLRFGKRGERIQIFSPSQGINLIPSRKIRERISLSHWRKG